MDTPTDTPTPGNILVGHVLWGAHPPQPDPLQALPITLTLKSSIVEVNYPQQNTDQYGFFTVPVGTLPSSTYNWRVKGPNGSPNTIPGFLANSGQVTLNGSPQTNVEMGYMLAGDCTGDNGINDIDAGIVSVSVDKVLGDTGYDTRADITGNNKVDNRDYEAVSRNVGFGGAPPIGPWEPIGKRFPAPASPSTDRVSSSHSNKGSVVMPGINIARSAQRTPHSPNDAYLELVPEGSAPPNGGTVALGSRFVLDLNVNSGAHTIFGQQSYFTFTNAILQNVDATQVGTGCVLRNTVTGDPTTFAPNFPQNEVCNGPGSCTFRGIQADPGSIAFMSVAGQFQPGGATGTFRVAQIGLCALAPGQAILHWQFSPPADVHRDTNVIGDYESITIVDDPALFTIDYVINVLPGPTLTPSNTPTITPTPTITLTRTRTRTPTLTRTPTITTTPAISNTPTATPTSTSTPIPTYTPTDTPTNTPTSTFTPLPTNTPADTSTDTPTDTPIFTHTSTPIPTDTATDTPTNTPTITPTNTPAVINLVGHVTWAGQNQPNALQQRFITLTLCSTSGGSTSTYTGTTDASGYFTANVASLIPGAYNWRDKGRNSLANGGTLTLTGSNQQADMGAQKGGDSDGSNVVNSQDFNILKNTFQSTTDPRADFNNDGVVNGQDFTILKNNFSLAGAPATCP